MKPSIFTPTHDPTYLPETYKSLANQSYDQWEWVIVDDTGSELYGAALDFLKHDKRVRVFQAPDSCKGSVGALKQFATLQCRGDIFVELDHDDMLFPEALEKIVMAAQRVEGNKAFIYSDFVEFMPDGGSRLYSGEYGWESYQTTFEGRPYDALRAFEPTPGSLQWIQFAPNHVRAWTREAYEALNGHDPRYTVGDDHDLVTRTYLDGTEFVHLVEPLYMQRVHSKNTSAEKNAEIQFVNRTLAADRTVKLIYEWCRRHEYDMEEFISPGLSEQTGDKKYGAIMMGDTLHRMEGTAAAYAIAQSYQRLVPGGWLCLQLPSTDHRIGFADPRAKSYWNEESFRYYTDRDYAPALANMWPNLQWCRYHAAHLHTGDDGVMQANLVALKGQRQPGLARI